MTCPNKCTSEVTSNSPPATVSSSVSMSSRIMMISYKEVACEQHLAQSEPVPHCSCRCLRTDFLSVREITGALQRLSDVKLIPRSVPVAPPAVREGVPAKTNPHSPREQPWRARAFPMPVESAGIPDLDLDQVLLSRTNVQRGSRATITADADAAERLRKLRSGVAGGDSVERMRKRGDVQQSASHRLEFRIDEFTNHDDFPQRGCIVNNIWLKASQCLTARVDA